MAVLRAVLSFTIVAACGWSCAGPPARPPVADAPSRAPDPPTTDPAIALGNLEAALRAHEAEAAALRLTSAGRAGLVELLLTRGQFLGRFADWERALGVASEWVAAAPAEPTARVARARALAAFHRFGEALAEVEAGRRLGAVADELDAVRATIFQATGRLDEALELRRRLSAAQPDIASLGTEACLLGERGDLQAAERRFGDARRSYRDVSPFPVAWLEFQEGRMWMRHGRLARARELFAAARARLPQYVAATSHLGEVEAALGHTERAIELLRAAADASADPDPAGHLALVLAEAGRVAEARVWRERAARGFAAVMARHPEAFADHAAEFWLGAGGDPVEALALARRNFALRPTSAARTLVERARQATQGEIGRGTRGS